MSITYAHSQKMCFIGHGRRFRGLGDGPPTKFEVGTAHASVPLNILRITVIGCEAKIELTEKGLQEEIRVAKGSPHFLW